MWPKNWVRRLTNFSPLALCGCQKKSQIANQDIKEVFIYPRFGRRPPMRPHSGPRMNEYIRVPQIRLIGSDGKQKGLFATDAAFRMAQEEGLDLVELDPHAKPPVCKIVDYGKYKYQLQKKQHESKKHQVVVHVKEIQMGPNISEHDIQFKIKHTHRFLEDKDKAKIVVKFRGREIQHVERAREILDRFIRETADVGEVESPPKMEGRAMMIFLAPKSK